MVHTGPGYPVVQALQPPQEWRLWGFKRSNVNVTRLGRQVPQWLSTWRFRERLISSSAVVGVPGASLLSASAPKPAQCDSASVCKFRDPRKCLLSGSGSKLCVRLPISFRTGVNRTKLTHAGFERFVPTVLRWCYSAATLNRAGNRPTATL